jgi:hypothetical protein
MLFEEGQGRRTEGGWGGQHGSIWRAGGEIARDMQTGYTNFIEVDTRF